jgi:hypothetical protein
MFVEIYQTLHSSVYSVSLIISIVFFDIFRSGRWFSPNRKRAPGTEPPAKTLISMATLPVLSTCPKSKMSSAFTDGGRMI